MQRADAEPQDGAVGWLQRAGGLAVAAQEDEVRRDARAVEVMQQGQELRLGAGGRQFVDQEANPHGRVQRSHDGSGMASSTGGVKADLFASHAPGTRRSNSSR